MKVPLSPLRVLLRMAATFTLITLPAIGHTAQWSDDGEHSTLGFEAHYDEIPFRGYFRSFRSDIQFHPDATDEARFLVTVQVASVDSNSPDRDAGMQEPEWFDTASFPLATWQAEGATKVEDGRYLSSGTLKLKGVEHRVDVEFTWQSDAPDVAKMSGSATMDRRDLGIGSGEWAEDDTIGFEVRVIFELQLRR